MISRQRHSAVKLLRLKQYIINHKPHEKKYTHVCIIHAHKYSNVYKASLLQDSEVLSCINYGNDKFLL